MNRKGIKSNLSIKGLVQPTRGSVYGFCGSVIAYLLWYKKGCGLT